MPLYTLPLAAMHPLHQLHSQAELLQPNVFWDRANTEATDSAERRVATELRTQEQGHAQHVTCVPQSCGEKEIGSLWDVLSSSKWESSPSRDENKKYLSCHHLVICWMVELQSCFWVTLGFFSTLQTSGDTGPAWCIWTTLSVLKHVWNDFKKLRIQMCFGWNFAGPGSLWESVIFWNWLVSGRFGVTTHQLATSLNKKSMIQKLHHWLNWSKHLVFWETWGNRSLFWRNF